MSSDPYPLSPKKEMLSLFKKTLAALLVSGLVLAFAACKSGDGPKEPTSTPADTPVGTPTDTPTQTPDEEEIDYESDLSTERFDGYDYRILVRKGNIATQWFEEPQEDAVDDAIYKRNKAVEDRYGITVSCAEGTGSNTDTSALNGILAGDDAYDIIFTHSRSAFSYATQGACYNALDIKSLHLDKPWWSKNIVNDCSINDRLYVLDGDISINGLSSAMCLMFNKRLFDELGYDYPYDMVRDGEWTFDEFAYLAKKGGKDLNGDGVMTPEDDQYGFWTGMWSAPINILYAGGQKVYNKNEEGELELTLYSNKTVQIFDSFFNLMNNEACFLEITEGSLDNYDGPAPFPAGRAMFIAGGLGGAKGYRDMDDDFGILPYPKFDEEDEYSTTINGAAPLACIPLTVGDPERTGAITEALAAYGGKYVLPAFYDVSLKTKYARDDDSEEMMDIIKDSIIFDVGYLCGGQYQSHGRDLSTTTNHDFSSWYSARESAAKTDLKNFNKDYAGIE